MSFTTVDEGAIREVVSDLMWWDWWRIHLASAILGQRLYRKWRSLMLLAGVKP